MIDSLQPHRLSGAQRTTPGCESKRRSSGASSVAGYNWHALSTAFGHTLAAENELAAAGWQTYFPLHLQRGSRGRPDKIAPLFGHYGFVRFHQDTDWGGLRRVRHVWDLLFSSPGHPAIVPKAAIDDLQSRTSPRRIVDDPLVNPPAPRFQAGQPLVIRSGPLAGLEGICGLSRIARISFLFQMMGQEQALDLTILDVEAL
jgi:transcription antitermination factor NusG